jgi:hypothetical protein
MPEPEPEPEPAAVEEPVVLTGWGPLARPRPPRRTHRPKGAGIAGGGRAGTTGQRVWASPLQAAAAAGRDALRLPPHASDGGQSPNLSRPALSRSEVTPVRQLSKAQLRALRQSFERFDADGNGELDAAEVRAVFACFWPTQEHPAHLPAHSRPVDAVGSRTMRVDGCR